MSSEAVAILEKHEDGNPSLAEFLISNGRLPFITDEIKPWCYRGWLIPYRQMAEAHPEVEPRYDYVVRTLEAGKLLDEPLPQIDFISEHDKRAAAGMKQIEEMIRIVEHKSASWNNFREICEWLGFALGVTSERSTLGDDVQEKLYRLFDLGPFLLNPTDYLGEALCQTNHGKRNGFFPTPMAICTMMAKMTHADDGRDRRHETAMDPALGTGRMLLVSSNYSMRLYGQDIDPLVVLISKINLALYAPWFHVPESFYKDREPSKSMKEVSSRPKTQPGGWNEPESGNKSDTEPANDPVRRPITTKIEQPLLFEL